MKTSLFFIIICFLFCSIRLSSSQHYLVAFSDETDTLKDTRTIQGTLCSDEEIPYALGDTQAYGKNQLHILSGKKRILIFTDTPLNLDLFFAFCNGHSQSLLTHSQSEMMVIDRDKIQVGQICKIRKKVGSGLVFTITGGEIIIEYNLLSKTVTVIFDHLDTELFYKGPTTES